MQTNWNDLVVHVATSIHTMGLESVTKKEGLESVTKEGTKKFDRLADPWVPKVHGTSYENPYQGPIAARFIKECGSTFKICVFNYLHKIG